jgi:DNA invertase Pin-like site-specific DNA recombinase
MQDQRNAVLYAAKSTADKHGSIPDQLADCRAASESEGRTVVATHQDEDASAFHGSRGPGLESAKSGAESLVASHGAAELWVQHSDRLARGDGMAAAHLIEHVLWARKTGVTLRSVQDNTTFSDLIHAVMMGERNHEDSRRKALAVKAGMERKAKRGEYNGPQPYGYRWDGPKGERSLVVHEPEAVIVGRIFEEFAAGRSQLAIARTLGHEGVRAQRGGEWYQGTLAKILANPVYVGRIRFNGEIHEGNHEAIVTTDLWERAQATREATARRPSKGRGRPSKASHLLGGGLLRCGLCGDAMIAREDSYRCNTRVRYGVNACEQVPIKRLAVDRPVLDYFEHAAIDMDATQRAIEATTAREIDTIRVLRAQAQQDEHRAAERLTRVKRDYQDGRLDADDWREQRAELTAALGAARAKLSQLTDQERRVSENAHNAAQEDVQRYLNGVRAAIVGGVQDARGAEAVRAALRVLFDRFTLRPLRLVEQDGTTYAILDSPDAPRDVIEPDLIGLGPKVGYEVVPHVRADAIAGYGPRGITPFPRSVALSGAEQKSAGSLQT